MDLTWPVLIGGGLLVGYVLALRWMLRGPGELR